MLLLLLATCNGVLPWQDPDEVVDTSEEGEPCLERTWYADADGDGFGLEEQPLLACLRPPDAAWDPGDCDDTDPDVHPRATERCNGVDDDCDGLMDPPEAEDTIPIYLDADGDDWGDPDTVQQACEAPEGWVEVGEDCDDDDPDAWPGAPDAWYDGVDSDCAGDDDYDADADAYLAEPWGTDCDDTDPLVNPGVSEVLDGRDEDCDGKADDSVHLDDAQGRVLGPLANSSLGDGALAVVGDMTGDGLPELALGDPDDYNGTKKGRLWVVSPDLGADVDLASTWVAELTGDYQSDGAGYFAAGGDIDGDGQADLLTSLTAWPGNTAGPGMVLLHLGPVSGSLTAASADTRLAGTTPWSSLGCSMAVHDLDSDGYDDLVLGAEDEKTIEDAAGATFVLTGPVSSGDVDVADAPLILRGGEEDQRAGSHVGAGDLDGDGWAEVLVGSERYDGSGLDRGAIYLFDASLSGDQMVEDADGTLLGSADSDKLHVLAVVQDVDGDGTQDLLVAAPLEDTGGQDAGSVYLVTDRPEGSHTIHRLATARLYGTAPDDALGSSLAGLGDVDGDGLGDLLLGAPGDSTSGSLAGAAWVVLGGLSGSTSVSTEAWSRIEGDAGDRVGTTVLGAGDLDGDGWPDLAVGAPGDDPDGRTDAGVIGLFPGWGS